MKRMKRCAHAGENQCLELALLQVRRELLQGFGNFQGSQSLFQGLRLIEDVAKVCAFEDREIKWHAALPWGQSGDARLWRLRSGCSLLPTKLRLVLFAYGEQAHNWKRWPGEFRRETMRRFSSYCRQAQCFPGRT